MRLLALLAAGLVAGTLMAAPVPKALKRSDTCLDGTWVEVEHCSGVFNWAAYTGERERWVIRGQSLTIDRVLDGVSVGKADHLSYSLVKPAGGSANAVDLTITSIDGSDSSRCMPGVYEVDGDTLTIYWASPGEPDRPAECKRAPGRNLYVLKRVKDEPKKDK